MSSAYWPLPVTKRKSSLRRTDAPMPAETVPAALITRPLACAVARMERGPARNPGTALQCGTAAPGLRGVYHRAGRRPDPVAPSGLPDWASYSAACRDGAIALAPAAIDFTMLW